MISRSSDADRLRASLLTVWQAMVMFAHIPEYLLPSPTAIAATIDRSLATSFAVTLGEALAGFIMASALAFVLATLFVRFHTLEEGLFPIAIAGRRRRSSPSRRCS